ncbi:MAG: hypothetical protein ACUVTX_00935, partial [Bacteroidales bacterium]
ILYLSVSGQVPGGFNYQAIARDADGNPITNEPLKILIGILTGVEPPVVIYEAEHRVTTNEFGLFQLMVGDPLAKVLIGDFSNIDWTLQPLYLRTKVIWNSNEYEMGSSRLLSVPYAFVAQGIAGLDKLIISGKTGNMEEALFEVKNLEGETVFAVYNEGVRINVGDGNKGVKGGFAIGGFDVSKDEPQEYLRVTSDSTRIYVKNPVKGIKGGFAIGGFDPGKGLSTGNFLNLTPQNYFIGQQTGQFLTTGAYNSVIGYKAGHNLTSGNSNTIIGHLADSSLTTGSNNIIIGQMAGLRLTSGSDNTLIGTSAGLNHTNQQYNVLIGTASGYNLNASGWNGSFNTFIGINSGYQIRNSRDNVFIGTNAGYWLDNGRGNTFVGIDAGRSGGPHDYDPGITGNYNIFVGYRAGYNIKNGDNNLSIGYESGYNNTDGSGNVFLGYQAGKNETGSNKLYLANSENNNLIYGDFSTKQVGINTTTLNKTLNVGGDAEITGTLTAASVIAPVTGNVTGNLSGNVNGMSMGRVFLEEDGLIISLEDNSFLLGWSKRVGEITLHNTSKGFYCNYWLISQSPESSTKGGAGKVNPESEITLIDNTNIDSSGFEIHFGRAEAGGKMCSVWLQFFNGALIGHYIIY